MCKRVQLRLGLIRNSLVIRSRPRLRFTVQSQVQMRRKRAAEESSHAGDGIPVQPLQLVGVRVNVEPNRVVIDRRVFSKQRLERVETCSKKAWTEFRWFQIESLESFG